MLIVSDTSAITNLIQVGQLDVLQQLFGNIIIPDAVYQELAVYQSQKDVVDRQSWIEVRAVKRKEKVKPLLEIIDAGEAEAIVLAQELNVELLIIDEKKGK